MFQMTPDEQRRLMASGSSPAPAAAPAATGHLRAIPLNVTWIDVSIHTHTPSHIQVRPKVVEGGVRRTQLPVEVQEFAAGVSKE